MKLGKIGKFAEFLGQLPCQKREDEQNTRPLSADAELTSGRVARDIERLQINKVAEFRGREAFRKVAAVSTRTDQLRQGAELTFDRVLRDIEILQKFTHGFKRHDEDAAPKA